MVGWSYAETWVLTLLVPLLFEAALLTYEAVVRAVTRGRR